MLQTRHIVSFLSFLAAVEEEVAELLQQIQRQSKNLIREGNSYAGQIPGGSYQMPASLSGLMGELRLHDREHRRQIDEMKVRLKEKGKSPRDIALAIQDRYEQIISGMLYVSRPVMKGISIIILVFFF